MAVRNLTEALDNLYTSTWQNKKMEAADNIFDATPFWFWMKSKGRLKSEIGGRFIQEPVIYAKSERTKFIGKGGTTELNENEFMTDTNWDWRYLTDSIVRYHVDEHRNRGKHKIISLMNAKLENSEASMVDKMEEVLFSNNALTAGQQALSFNSLDDLVADDPTTGTVGDINAATYSWWRNKFNDMASTSFSVSGVTTMRTMLNDCGQNKKNDFPDIIVSGQTPYEYYEDAVGEQKRIVNKTLGDAGFESIQFKGIPMIWSPQCSATRMYFLNTRDLRFRYDPMVFFDMTDWKAIPNQVNDRVAQVMVAGNLVCRRRRTSGVIFGIDTE